MTTAATTDETTAAAPRAGKPDRLPLPDKVELDKINWLYAIPIVAVHALALAAAVPWLFTWTGLVVGVLGIHVYGQAINMCYHRQLTHKAYKTPKWFERAFVVMALWCLQDTPARWVATHRYHHQASDEQDDPHSPLVSFLWAHVGWLMVRNPGIHNVDVYRRYANDVLQDRFYMYLEKRPIVVLLIYLSQIPLYFAAGFAIGWATVGPMEGLRVGASLVIWGVFVRTVGVWHITWSVNSLTHLFGYRNYQTDEHSTNNWFVALVTVGEGWHNNHHHDPASATNQHRWWEFDISYYEIKLLQWLGLAKDVTPRREARVAEAMAKAEAKKLQPQTNADDRG